MLSGHGGQARARIPTHLWHFSEDPAHRAVRAARPGHQPGPAADGLDDRRASTRRCSGSRATAPASRSGPTTARPPTGSAPTTAPRVHAIEAGWLDRMRACQLFVYRFAVDGFEPWPDADGYWVADRRARRRSTSRRSATCSSGTASVASSCACSPTCAPLRDAVIASGYRFSMAGWPTPNELSPAPGAGSGTG